MVKKIMFFCLCLGFTMLGFGFGNFFKERQIEVDNFVLKKEFYECYLGMILPDPEQPRVCVVYRVKGLDLGAYPNNRHRDNNSEQGKSIRSNEQIVRDILEN